MLERQRREVLARPMEKVGGKIAPAQPSIP